MKKRENSFDGNDYLGIVFWLALVLFALLSIFKIFYSCGLFVDPLEHLRASYFVQNGLVPYRDFFEHHNPLLWFMLAPLTKLLEGNLIIIPLVRILSFVLYLVCIYLVYLINAKFIYGKRAAECSTLVLISLPIWADIANLRPDILMLLCFLAAIYLFYSYLEKKNVLKLIGCYTLISISFLFLQKILFLAFGFGLVNLWFLYKKELKIKDVFVAVSVALVPLLIFGAYLLHNGIFGDWFYYNFTFNTIMREYYADYQLVSLSINILFFVSALLIFKLYSHNLKALPIFVPLMCIFLSLLYFFPHPQYAMPYFMLASIYFGKFCEDVKIFSHKITFIAFISILFFSISVSYPEAEEIKAHEHEMKTIEYINKIEPDKTVVPVTIMMYPIFRLPLNYHWFGYFNVAIIDVLYTSGKYFDFADFLEKTKPDYLIYTGQIQGTVLPENMSLYHRVWFKKRNQQILKKMKQFPELKSKLTTIDADFWGIKEEWIKENYTQIEGTDVYKRNDLKE